MMALNFKIFTKLSSERGRKQAAWDSHLPINKVTRKSPQGPAAGTKKIYPCRGGGLALCLRTAMLSLLFCH